MNKMKSNVRKFYEYQNEIIEGLIDMENITNGEIEADNSAEMSRAVRVAINVSFFFNISLFVVKVIAAIQSSSLSVIASALDSLLDILSGAILFLISRAIRRQDRYRYPAHKSKMESVGIIAFAVVMSMASLRIIEDCLTTVANGIEGDLPSIDVDTFTLCVLVIAVCVKFTLGIFCLVVARRYDSTSAMALAEDHRNDVVTNIVGLIGAYITQAALKSGNDSFHKLWFFDSLCAFLLSVYIIYNWILAGKEQTELLVGASASPQFIGQLAYLAAHHDPRILLVDKVLAYHSGARFVCEVDIVLPETMLLKEAHNIGESLEKKIEQMGAVERAYVHLDFETDHKAEHEATFGKTG